MGLEVSWSAATNPLTATVALKHENNLAGLNKLTMATTPLYGTSYGMYLLLAFVALFVVFLVLYLVERDKNQPQTSPVVRLAPKADQPNHPDGAKVTAPIPVPLYAASETPKGFVTVELMGGLGNQLFQLAAAYAYGRDHNKTLILNHTQTHVGPRRTYFDSVYQWVQDSRDIKRKNWHKIAEPHFHYAPLPDAFGNVRLYGYFQSLKYFDRYADEIVTLFKQGTPPLPLDHPTVEALRNAFTETVSLHIRRSDYVGNAMHPVQTLEYYQKALKALREKINITPQNSTDPLMVVVFSDDLPWCQTHLPAALDDHVELVYVESQGLTDAQELVLMSECNHHIIANSSFSWWGAVYNQKPNKVVVAPQHWFGNTSYNWQDVYGPDWLVV